MGINEVLHNLSLLTYSLTDASPAASSANTTYLPLFVISFKAAKVMLVPTLQRVALHDAAIWSLDLGAPVHARLRFVSSDIFFLVLLTALLVFLDVVVLLLVLLVLVSLLTVALPFLLLLRNYLVSRVILELGLLLSRQLLKLTNFLLSVREHEFQPGEGTLVATGWTVEIVFVWFLLCLHELDETHAVE